MPPDPPSGGMLTHAFNINTFMQSFPLPSLKSCTVYETLTMYMYCLNIRKSIKYNL